VVPANPGGCDHGDEGNSESQHGYGGDGIQDDSEHAYIYRRVQ
jgi:hypothetical protein